MRKREKERKRKEEKEKEDGRVLPPAGETNGSQDEIEENVIKRALEGWKLL